MIPSTVDELRVTLRGWPVAALRVAVAAALPALDTGAVALVADWLLSDVPDRRPAFGREQAEAIWMVAQRRAQEVAARGKAGLKHPGRAGRTPRLDGADGRRIERALTYWKKVRWPKVRTTPRARADPSSSSTRAG